MDHIVLIRVKLFQVQITQSGETTVENQVENGMRGRKNIQAADKPNSREQPRGKTRKGGVASPTPGTGIKSCGCFLPDLTKFTF